VAMRKGTGSQDGEGSLSATPAGVKTSPRDPVQILYEMFW
jgi:hypothetical protein